MWQQLLQQLIASDPKALARSISLVENEAAGYEELMRSLPSCDNSTIIGITGPPGAGKSTIVNALVGEFANQGKTCVLCVDPSSPFTFGAVLGDRIRMNDWYKDPDVYIRSLATRGSLGGLNPKIIEISELAKAAGFTRIIIETVGVGQSEVEIAALADITIVVMVPESGDEIQTMKSGLMEIADIFVINKCDRPGADKLVQSLHLMSADHKPIPIIKAIATQKDGIAGLKESIVTFKYPNDAAIKIRLLADKAYHLIQNKKMADISRERLYEELKNAVNLNLYKFIEKYV